ncbi:unnamed protein product [Coregonus sp. 'balchen']|nr:unnamed protein product [Coregonus sp. 'balchen']
MSCSMWASYSHLDAVPRLYPCSPAMSRSVIQPLSAGANAPEALSLLEPVERDPIQRPASPLKMHRALREPGGEGLLWRQCYGLVSRVCHMESLLQTLKLTTFRLETERDLDPLHSARLKEQLSALQQESDEEQRASRREACLDRDESREEVQRLGEALEVATASKMDVALAAEELKMVKVQMSEKLLQLKDQMSQESARSFQNEKPHSALLQRVEEMERVVEKERRQAQTVQADCHALRSDGQATRQGLEEEKDRGHRLQEQCEQLKGQADARLALQQQENSRQRGVVWPSSWHEQDLLLEEARRNIQAELKGALSAKVKLQMELETLKVDHAQLLQSSTVAQETVVTQRELLERTIERLRGDLDSAVKEGEVVRTDRDSAKTEYVPISLSLGHRCIVVTKLECERSALETQLAKVKLEAGTLSSTLQKQEEENRRLMGKLVAMEHQQTRVDQLQEELQALRDTHVESVQQHKLSSVLEDKYTQTGQAAVQVKEGEVTSVVAARDEALRDSRTLRGQRTNCRSSTGTRVGAVWAQTLENVLASHSHRNTTLRRYRRSWGDRAGAGLTQERQEVSVCLYCACIWVYVLTTHVFVRLQSQREIETTGRGGEAPRHHGNNSLQDKTNGNYIINVS